MSKIAADNLRASTAGVETPMVYPVRGSAKAWVNFNGTGTAAIKDSLNVSSLTDNGSGDFTQNATSAMTNGNYACALGCLNLSGANHDMDVSVAGVASTGPTLKSASQLRILTGNVSVATNVDNADTSVEILGSLA